MKLKKIYIFFLSLILITSMSCVSAGLFDGLFGEDDSNKNITLLNESTHGWARFYDDGDIYTVYYLEGVLKDLPNNIDDYTIKLAIFDEKGDLIKEDDGNSIYFISKRSEKLDPVEIGAVHIDDYKNISIIELKVFDADGIIVYDKNITFTMQNMEIDYVTKNTSNSNDDSINLSAMSYDEFNEWMFNDDNGYWDNA